jgi:uncharacterized protein
VVHGGRYTFLRVLPGKWYTILRVATKIGRLAQEISQLNPWWREPIWADFDPDLRDVAATGLGYRHRVLDQLQPGCVYILRGPRRVGKTVAVKQQIHELLNNGAPPTSIVRIAADGWAAKEIRTVVQNTALPPLPRGHHRTWFFDEISAVTGEWAQQIKWLRDNDGAFRESTVVLTGSNASALTDAAGTLAGRRGTGNSLDRTLLPLGFRTFVALVRGGLPTATSLSPSQLRTPAARAAYNEMLPWLDDLVRLWELYLSYGGFPKAVAAAAVGQPIPSSVAEDMFNVIAGDAFRNSKLSVTTEVALLERLWSAMASPANLANVANDIGVSADVVVRHVGYLGDSYLSWRCAQRAEDAWLPRERAQDKIYAIDPLVARLAHLRNPQRADIDPTVLTEMQIGMAIRRSVIRANPIALNDDFLFHARTPTRKEIDFVSRDLAGVAIEGKYVEDGGWYADAATVNASEWDGILCTRNVLDLDRSQAWAVPAALLAYALDT